MNYFILTASEDGGHAECISRSELLKRLNEDYWGSDVEFQTSFPSNKDMNYWGGKVVIIKGDVVAPKAVEVVKRYEV